MDKFEDSSPSTWDNLADSYDELRTDDWVYRSCIRQVVKPALKARPKKNALDVGCGTGLVSMPLAEKFENVIAVDYSLESLKVLKSKAAGKPVLLIQADIARLPFKDAAFDAVTCANMLQHLTPGPSQETAAKELQRVQKSGAPLIVSVHHFSRRKRKLNWKKQGISGEPGVDFLFRFSRAELAKLFDTNNITSAGFYSLYKIPYLGARMQNLVAALWGKWAARLGAGHMLVVNKRKER